MLRILKYFLSFVLCGSIVSCSGHRLEKEVEEFMGREVVIPRQMLKVEEGSPSLVDVEAESPLYVMFYGKGECTSCAISHLYDYVKGLQKIKDSGKCGVMVVFSPEEEEVVEAIDNLKGRNYDFPVYVDTGSKFYDLNKDFPEDVRFHKFLLGPDGHPVYVGNPMLSEDLWNLFVEKLDEL